MTIFTNADVTASVEDFHAASAKFKETYGFDHDGIGVVGFKDYWEAAEYNVEMAKDGSLLSSWDCYLFVADLCTYEEYVTACADGTVTKYYEIEG